MRYSGGFAGGKGDHRRAHRRSLCKLDWGAAGTGTTSAAQRIQWWGRRSLAMAGSASTARRTAWRQFGDVARATEWKEWKTVVEVPKVGEAGEVEVIGGVGRKAVGDGLGLQIRQ